MKKISDELGETLRLFRKKSFHGAAKLNTLTANDLAVFGVMSEELLNNPASQCVGVSQIGQRLHMSKPALTQAINRLEDKELVERVICKSDRRATFVRVTPLGEKTFGREKEQMDKCMEKLVERMGEEDTRQFILLLRKFHHVSCEIGKEYKEKEKKHQ